MSSHLDHDHLYENLEEIIPLEYINVVEENNTESEPLKYNSTVETTEDVTPLEYISIVEENVTEAEAQLISAEQLLSVAYKSLNDVGEPAESYQHLQLAGERVGDDQ